MTAARPAAAVAPRAQGSNVLTAAGAVAVALPAVLCLGFVLRLGVNVAFEDHLESAVLFAKMDRGRLQAADLFAQHNEHRLLFPRLVTIGLGSITRFDTRAEMLVSWGLLCGLAAVLLADHRREGGTLLAFVPVSCLVFGWRQYDLLLRGDGIPTYLSTAAVVAALAALGRARTWRGLVMAAVPALVASFSYLNGLIVWLLGVLVLATSKEARGARRPMLAAWAALGALAVLGYLLGFKHPAHHPSLLHALRAPGEALAFLATLAGGASATVPFAAAVLGAIALGAQAAGLALAWARRRDGLPLAVWVVAFAIATQLLVTVGRSGFGVEVALTSRYTPFAALGVAGAYLLALSARRRGARGARPLLVLPVLLAVLTAGVSYTKGASSGQAAHEARRRAAYILSTFPVQPDHVLNEVYPNPALVRRWGRVLRNLRLNVFAGDGAPAAVRVSDRGGAGWIEQAVRDADLVYVDGWAIDPEAHAPGRAVYVSVAGVEMPALYGIDRPDVAEVHHDRRMRRSGFQAFFRADRLPPGEHAVSARVVGRDGTIYRLREGVKAVQIP